MTINKITEYKLINGLKLIVKEDHRSPVAIFQIIYKVGSSYEYSGITGISHALEHMMFRGSKKYSAKYFLNTISEFGGQQNAFTTRDYTSYYMMLNVSQLDFALSTEADRMSNLLLNKNDFRNEMKIVMEERRMMVEDNHQHRLLEYFCAVSNLSGPYHHQVIGWMDDLKHLTIDDVRTWYKTWYVPNNAICIIVGDVKPTEMLKLARKYFENIKSSKLPILKQQSEIYFPGKRIVRIKSHVKFPFVLIGYNTPVINTADESWKPYALLLLCEILAGGISSRMHMELVRNKKMLLDVSYTYSPIDRISNVLTFSATLSTHSSLELVHELLINEIRKIQKRAPVIAELKRTIAQMNSSRIYQYDSILQQAREIGEFEAVGLSWREINRLYQQIENLKPKQIKQVAQEFLIHDRLITATMEPK